jgi:protein-S-isoprenylcysteine O-methyltransferase Ste14
MRWLELKLPPPALLLLLAGLMWLAPVWVAPLPWAWRIGWAAALLGLGLAIGLVAVHACWRAGTTIHPTHPMRTTALVTGGAFRYSRNPMYLCQLLCLLAWAAYLSNPLALALTPLFVLYLNRFQIEPEERALAALFGARYVAYQARVRRWL